MKLDSKSKKKLAAITVVTLLLVFAMGYVIYSFMQPKGSGNYAQEVVKPIEKLILDKGAIKKFGGGDEGKGPGNNQPYYDAGYEVPGSKEEVIAAVEGIVASEGFKLARASTENRGYLITVGDEYISDWYFDDTSRENPYSELRPGKIQLGFRIGDDEKQVPVGYTYIRINIQLPSYR